MIENKMVLTDLDGTLLQNDSSVSATNVQTLRMLGKKNTVRVAATGRTLYSARKVLSGDFPVDYLIFSSGAGIYDWHKQTLIHSNQLGHKDISLVAELFNNMDLDYTIHHPIPENHCFFWFASSKPTSDFLTRVKMYEGYTFCGDYRQIKSATQFLAVSLDGERIIDKIKKPLSHLSIIRATSPLDHNHTWIEVFPMNVSKGHAADWLCKALNISKSNTMSIGNDYNDLHMLHWTASSYVVKNATSALHNNKQFTLVPSNQDNGFSHAVDHWLNK